MSDLSWRQRLLSREVVSFLTVGGTGYVVDVAAFNWLRSLTPFAVLDPTVARTIAVLAAMVVTYIGNSVYTWSRAEPTDKRREIALFVVFNVIGFGFSVVILALSHDLLGLTSRLADNISANVVGLALGTAFRFWSYRRFVFASAGAPEPTANKVARLPQ
ncbi:MAG: GtrA family protein [Marmoricola sp.]